MKTSLILTLTGGLALAPALWLALAQTRFNERTPFAVGPVPHTVEHESDATTSVAAWGVDPVTFELIGPASAAEQVRAMNTPEQIEARRRAILSVTNPEEYERLFPKSAETREAGRAAAEARPISLHELYERSTPEERARIDRAYEALFDVHNEKGVKADRDKERPVE